MSARRAAEQAKRYAMLCFLLLPYLPFLFFAPPSTRLSFRPIFSKHKICGRPPQLTRSNCCCFLSQSLQLNGPQGCPYLSVARVSVALSGTES
ncbi:hypothetical protein CDEST_02641 [Colletotrichum destructivum]|uniref:Secreted protein n=1 Tax=Colletotrichum destructivum TaxID=34406 RepID=A0AAX4I3B9_9PEZI|nr:hypothetical protein CDEST_02641 [Colletotrichum destructivum]